MSEGLRERAVRIEIPADVRYASVVRMAAGAAAGGWAGAEDARDLAAAVGEALVLAGIGSGCAATCVVDIELKPAGVSVLVSGPGPAPADEEGEMARLMLAGLVDDFAESAGTGTVDISLRKAFAAVQ